MNPASSSVAADHAVPSACLLQLPEYASAQMAAGEPLLQNANLLHQVRARLHVCVGEATLSVGELLAARQAQVIELDRRVDQPVDFLLEGQVIARGHLVAVGDHFAVRISELPITLKV